MSTPGLRIVIHTRDDQHVIVGYLHSAPASLPPFEAQGRRFLGATLERVETRFALYREIE